MPRKSKDQSEREKASALDPASKPLLKIFKGIQESKNDPSLWELYRDAFALCWPDEDFHRWVEVILRAILDHKMTVVMGPKSTAKTHSASKWALIDYWAFPDITCCLVSSTELRGANLRIWGDIKSLLASAKRRYPWLAGTNLEARNAIATDILDDDCAARDLRKGIIFIPCKNSAGRYLGLGAFAGIKNKRMRLVGDECQFLQQQYLDVPSNLDANPDFKGVLLGNPLDTTDALGRAAEPLDGWNSVGEPKKTTIWITRFLNGCTVNLVGTDSPNFDPPLTDKPRYPYLIHAGSIASTVQFYGMNSQQYWSQCVGIMKTGVLARRVLTMQICEQHNAMQPVVWKGGDAHVKIYAVDVAYGNIGGDRCVGGWIEFGRAVDGTMTIFVNEPVIIPVVPGRDTAEDSIANFVREECKKVGIAPENVFYDATGRGSMGTSFARLWSANVNPVEFGGRPSKRAVSDEFYVYDQVEKKRRLKRCDEQYKDRVTEFWFSVRYCVEGNQMRNLPEDIAREGCQREWKMTQGNLIEVEEKAAMKERTGRSPDLFDWLVTAVEGARQRGFQIAKLANVEYAASNLDWLEALKIRSNRLARSGALVPES